MCLLFAKDATCLLCVSLCEVVCFCVVAFDAPVAWAVVSRTLRWVRCAAREKAARLEAEAQQQALETAQHDEELRAAEAAKQAAAQRAEEEKV